MKYSFSIFFALLVGALTLGADTGAAVEPAMRASSADEAGNKDSQQEVTEENRFAVVVDSIEDGKIVLDPPLPEDGRYPAGTKVIVKGIPDEGYEVDSVYYSVPGRWGAMYHESLEGEFSVTIDQDKNLGASFIERGKVESIDVIHNVAYAKPGNKQLKYDVYRPVAVSGKPLSGLPMVVIIHGGGWSTNDEDIMRGLARELVKTGKLVACSIDYRWIGEGDGDQPATTMANLIEDVFGAILHVREHADEYGGDPNRIGVTGDSAGGHLSASAATLIERIGDDGFGKKEGVFQYRPTYVPPGMELDEAKRQLLQSTRAAAPSYGVFAAEVLGRFQPGMGDAAGEAVAPQSNVPPIKSRKIPHYVMRGTGDFLIGKEAVQAYVDALAEKGQLTVYDEVDGAGHAFFDWKPNADVKATFQQYGVPYAAKMREFFVEHLDAD